MSYYDTSILFAKRLILRYVFGKTFERNQKFVQEEYEEAWRKWDTSRGGSGFFSSKPIPAFHGNKTIFSKTIDIQGSNIQEIAKEIARMKPKSVLELGSGVGINLLALSILCPEVKKWHGIELTQSGVEIARRLLVDTPRIELAQLTSLPKEIIAERVPHADITFTKGTILSLPFADNSFDVVFSHEVFEQIPHSYEKGMREAYRVTKKYAVFVEAFREAQRNIFQKMHQRNVDYFRWSYQKILALGFTLVTFTQLPLVKKSFSDGMLVCKKSQEDRRVTTK